MRATTLKFLMAMILGLTLAACQSSKTTTEETVTAQPAQEEEASAAETSGAGPEEEVSGISTEIPLTAENWAHHPSNYTGDTKTFTIYFDFDQSTIPVEAYESLKAHADHIAKTGKVVLRLEGHADRRGTREYNMALGERRAQAVMKFLRINGAQPSKMEVVSYGEEKPVAFGDDEMSWAQNRRVELNYVVGRP